MAKDMIEINTKNKDKIILIKDKQKGQKIIAAIHLVVKHLPDTLSLKNHLCDLSILLVREQQFNIKKHYAGSLQTLLESAVMLGYISDKNASIIIYEVNRFVSNLGDLDNQVVEIFAPVAAPYIPKNVPQKSPLTNSETYSLSENSNRQNQVSVLKEVKNNRDSRKDEIMSFINSRTATSIKDIVSLFPGLSEKTIQRELVSLVTQNKILKKGDKRWSTYLPLHAQIQ